MEIVIERIIIIRKVGVLIKIQAKLSSISLIIKVFF